MDNHEVCLLESKNRDVFVQRIAQSSLGAKVREK